VTVYEQKPSVARKLLMAGRGGLNITHSEELDRFIARYGAAAERLGPLIRAFPPASLREFCAELGETTFVGSSGRVFPKSFKASPLLRALLARLSEAGVEILTRHRFQGVSEAGEILLTDARGEWLRARHDAVILALGGASWPRLGADGGWTAALAARGVDIAPLAPANCGLLVDWPEAFRTAFEGAPVKTVALRHGEERVPGDLVVTRIGLEGGPAYALSSSVRRAIEARGETSVAIDLRPGSSIEAVTERLERPRGKQSRSTFLRKALNLSKLETALLRLSGPPPSDAAEMAALVKAAPLVVRGTAGLERAISSSGGVRFAELDEGLMLTKMPGVFVCGEMLDFDAPTGGYLLQAAFSTGVAAAEAAARFLKRA
jgi:hypothetical protein